MMRQNKSGGALRDRARSVPLIGKVLRGTRVAGLIRYLYGPGRHEEHTDPRLVAGWRDPAELEPLARVDGRRDLRRLHGLLDQPLAALGRRGFDKPVWHCVARAAPGDPVLSDDQWARTAEEIMHRTGLAPTNTAARAARMIRSCAFTDPAAPADAAWAATDALHIAADVLGSRALRQAADSYARAARHGYGRIPGPTPAGDKLRDSQRHAAQASAARAAAECLHTAASARPSPTRPGRTRPTARSHRRARTAADLAWLEFPNGSSTPRSASAGILRQEPTYPPTPRHVSQPRQPRGPSP
jgi:hypothetical protein